MWHHPKYYKELRKRNKLDQAISTSGSTERSDKRSPGPGLKPQASSVKPQATVDASNKLQAPSGKHQASSRKQQAAR